MRRMSVAIAVLASLLIAQTASAMKYDLSLWRLCDRNENGQWIYTAPDNSQWVHNVGDGSWSKWDEASRAWIVTVPPSAGWDPSPTPRNDLFRSFVRQFALVLAPKPAAPSETLGRAGWNVGAEWSFNWISNGQEYWQVLRDVDPSNAGPGNDLLAQAPPFLSTVQFHARKGLPFSTEIGATFSYLVYSQMFTAGAEFKGTVLEGFKWYPDVAFRVAGNHLFGADDLSLTTISWDLSVGKTFGIGGLFQLAPYTGYSLVYATASAGQLDPDFSDRYTEGGQRSSFFTLDGQNMVLHRWLIGCMFKAGRFALVPEFILTSGKVYNLTLNAGLDF